MKKQTDNKKAPSRPLRHILAGLMLVAVAGGLVCYALAAADAANNAVASQRSDDADAWNELRASCVDFQAARLGKKDGIEQCTDYADEALQAAKREKLSLAAYITNHNKELQWLPEAARQHVAGTQKPKG